MRALITVDSGSLSSTLADWTIQNINHQVIGIDNLSGEYRNIRITSLTADIYHYSKTSQYSATHDLILSCWLELKADVKYHKVFREFPATIIT